jgi:2-furoyl-CoA dehydrogenase FAD binding subunit
LPLVAAALPFVGHFQTRNKGTVCGSIAHADPSSELPLVLAVLGGEVVLRSEDRGERVLTAGSFQKDMFTTARAPDELITKVIFPSTGPGVAFREIARRHGDFAIIALAATMVESDVVQLGVGGIAGRPMVRRIVVERASASVAEWAEELEGFDDLHASSTMRRDLFRNLAPQVLAEAIRCAA